MIRFLGLVLPSRLTPVHHFLAWLGGYFWIPCILCGRPWGGHQWHDRRGFSCTIEYGRNAGHGICPACTKRGEAHP